MTNEREALSMPARFWINVEPGVTEDECWLWRGTRQPEGYGRFRVSHPRRAVGAHCVAYELEVGPIPAGWELDHLCRTPSCVNPAHLEPVTHVENVRRGRNANREKACCPRGHLYGPKNAARGRARRCLVCHAADERKRRVRS